MDLSTLRNDVSDFAGKNASPAYLIFDSCVQLIIAQEYHALQHASQDPSVPGYLKMYFAAIKIEHFPHFTAWCNLDDLVQCFLKGISECRKEYRDCIIFAKMYFRSVCGVTHRFVFNRIPIRAIKPVMKSINWWTDDKPNRLTPAHTQLFRLCLNAQIFWPALPYMELDIEFLFKEGRTARNAKKLSTIMALGEDNVLDCLLKLAHIHTRLGNYEEAFFYVDVLIWYKGSNYNDITRKAFHLTVLLAAILGREKLIMSPETELELPNYENVIIPCHEYFTIVKKKPISDALRESEKLINGISVGAYKKMMNDAHLNLRMRAVHRLAQAFLQVTEKQLVKYSQYENEKSLLSLMTFMAAKNLIEFKYDDAKKVYTFPKKDVNDEIYDRLLDLSKLVEEVSVLKKYVNIYDSANGA